MFNQVRKPSEKRFPSIGNNRMPSFGMPPPKRMPSLNWGGDREIIGYTPPIDRGRPKPVSGPRLMVENYYDEPPRPIYAPRNPFKPFMPVDSTNPVRPKPFKPISVFNPSLEGRALPYTEAIHSDLGIRKDTSSTAVGLTPNRQTLQSEARLPTAMPSTEPIQKQTNFSLNI